MNWLDDFVAHSSYGEASERLMWWIGVSVIAGVLRRKVFIDEQQFQWSPNFYILVVGEPGTVRKSTSMNLGLRLLKRVEGIKMGPAIVTWQALIEHIAECKEEVVFDTGEIFEMSCVTIGLSEFGSFFDPTNRELIDNLTDLWDGRLDTIKKMTKTSGNNEMVNPWINIIAATTPKWLAQNFGDTLVGGGLASRFIFLHETMPTRDIAYPSRQMPTRSQLATAENKLVAGLEKMALYSGEVRLTEEAYQWGEQWYVKERAALRALGSGNLESGFIVRKQVHLHKLALVMAAADSSLPWIELRHLEAAKERLDALDADTASVFGYVGQTKVMSAAREIVEALDEVGQGGIERRILYRKRFFRTMTVGEFNEAVNSAVQAELILEQMDPVHPLLIKRR